MDTTSNGHNAETGTQRRNELLDTSSKPDISPKSLIGRNAENGHNAETGTQRRNELLDTSSKPDISPKSLIGRNAENGHNVEKRKLTLGGSEIGRRSRSCNCLKRLQTVLQKQIKTDGYNVEWTQRRMDTTSKRIVGHIAETGHNTEISYWTQCRKWTQRQIRADEVYISKWFGYPYFDFMKNKNEPGDTQGIDKPINHHRHQQEQHTEETSTNVPTQEPARKKRRNISKTQTQPQLDSADIMLAEALDCLNTTVSNDINDPYLSFGRHIANEMRNRFRQIQAATIFYTSVQTNTDIIIIVTYNVTITCVYKPSPTDNFDFEAQDITSL
ncbi:hypothetical protein FQR65_LT19276 [Abscondita terminalis]|nr:hypothetical protein FQR65_LT19276 [Abscondita terminalis]